MRVLAGVLPARTVSASPAGGEVEVGNGKRLSLRDANARVAQQPHDDAMVVRAVRVQERAVLVGAEEVVRALRARWRIDRPNGIAPWSAIAADEELGLLEVGEEDA